MRSRPVPTRRSLPAPALAAALAATLAGCEQPAAPVPAGGAPHDLEFSIGGYGSTSTFVRVRGDTVVLVRRAWDWSPGEPRDSVRTVPDAAAWNGFWQDVERAGVHRWRREYVAEGWADGTGWGLRLEADGRRLESTGSNAYPDADGREHEGVRTPAFDLLIHALGELAGRPL